jgi:hypothetical protein
VDNQNKQLLTISRCGAGGLAVHNWQAKALFIGSFLLGLIVWPSANEWSDFVALCCVSFSVAGLSILLMDIYLM